MLLNLHAPDDMPALLRATAPRPGPAGPGCLDDEHIAAIVDGTLDPGARAAAIEHLAECARCRDAVASVVRLATAQPVAREMHRVEYGRGVPRRFWWRLPVGLAAAAAVALLLLPGRNDRGADDRRREPSLTATIAPRPLEPRGSVTALPVLRWASVPNADRYRVRVFTADGTVLWESEGVDTVAGLPAGVTLQPEASYYWKVEARTGWDRWVGSDLVEFRLERPVR